MPSIQTLSAVAALAFSAVSQARPIPSTVSLYRRSVLNANDGVLVVQNKAAPQGYDYSHLEKYDKYHFRYMAIGCEDVAKEEEFFNTCCHPRKIGRELDTRYPAACNLDSYLVFDPEYKKDVTVAKLGSVRDYQGKVGYEQTDDVAAAPADDNKADADNKDSAPASASSAPSSSSSAWSSGSSAWSSGSSSWSSSSSSSSWTPEPTPEWTPSSSSSAPSETWTPEASSSSSSDNDVWNGDQGNANAAAWTPSSSSQWVAPAAATPDNSGSSGDFTGTASWFTQNGNAGACGIYHSDNDYIVAIAASMWGNLGVKSADCGRSITITNTDTGATAQAVVADACPGCAARSYHALDLSTGLFSALGNLDQGILNINWHFN